MSALIGPASYIRALTRPINGTEFNSCSHQLGHTMSADCKENPEKTGTDSSRRKLRGTAELLAGAVASVVTTESALARPTDVFLDSSGRVHIKGTTAQGATERIQTAA